MLGGTWPFGILPNSFGGALSKSVFGILLPQLRTKLQLLLGWLRSGRLRFRGWGWRLPFGRWQLRLLLQLPGSLGISLRLNFLLLEILHFLARSPRQMGSLSLPTQSPHLPKTLQ